MFNTVITFNLWSSSVWSSLENYTSNNTRQHEYNMNTKWLNTIQHQYNTTQHEYNTTQREYKTRQHDTTRVQHHTTRHNRSTTRHNTSTTRHSTSTIQYKMNRTQLNTSTEGARTAKIEPYIALFVTELYFFLISFRNSYYSPTCNIVSTLCASKAYNTSFRNVKQPRTYGVLR